MVVPTEAIESGTVAAATGKVRGDTIDLGANAVVKVGVEAELKETLRAYNPLLSTPKEEGNTLVVAAFMRTAETVLLLASSAAAFCSFLAKVLRVASVFLAAQMA